MPWVENDASAAQADIAQETADEKVDVRVFICSSAPHVEDCIEILGSSSPNHLLQNVRGVVREGNRSHTSGIRRWDCRSFLKQVLIQVIDDIGAQQPHDFKSSVFSIPTTCEYCHVCVFGVGRN
jgi:hypothetical protein